MMLGAWRSMARRILPNVSPIASRTWHWLMPAKLYSTGSSAVMILRSGRLSSFRAPYRVVVLPEPVGPVTRKMPLGRLMIFWNAL